MNENWTPKNPPPQLSDSDAELLSAYLDNMLDAREKAALEARLATDAFLRSELAAMRQMLGWLKTMPTLKAPRNFTISEADVKATAPKIIAMPRRNTGWQIASAAAVFVVILGGALLFSQLGFSPAAEQPANNIAARTTQTAEPSRNSVEQATEGFIPPQENANAGGEPEEEAADERGEPSDTFAFGTEVLPTGANAELAPQSASGGTGSGQDSSNSTGFGGGADGQTADIVIETTATSNAAPVSMSTATAILAASPQPSATAQPTLTADQQFYATATALTALLAASPSPQATLSAELETRNFEPTLEAATSFPQPTQEVAFAPTMVAVTGTPQPAAELASGTTLAATTEEAAAEESMTMMLVESTEAPLVDNESDDNDTTAQTGIAASGLMVDIPDRINAIKQRILQDILER